MAIKLTSLTISKRIPKWVNQNAFISSLSCTNSFQTNPEIDNDLPNTTDFETKIQTLRNKLCPDNLIRVLDCTHDLNLAVRIFKWAALQKPFNHTVDTYYLIILKLGLAGNVNEMEGFCQKIVKHKCSDAEKAFVSLIYAFVKHSRLNEAVRVLVHMNLGGFKASVDVFNVLLGALVQEKRGFKDVVFVYKEMVKAGVVPNVDTLNYLLDILFETDHVELALDQFRRMNKKGCHPNGRTFEIVITGLIEKNQVDDSVIILHEMFEIGCQPELSFHNSVIPHFCRKNKVDEIVRLFRMARTSNFVLDLLVYGELITCLCKNHRLGDALTILQNMMEIGITPTADMLVDLAHGFCKIGKFDEALYLLEETASDLASPYNALLEGYCNAGNFFMAKTLLETLSERETADCDSWNVLISWLCENVGIKNANELLGRMIISSISPDSATYSALVIGNCKLGKYEDALELFHRVRTTFWVLDSLSYAKFVEGLCKIEKIEEAAEVFHYMSSNCCSLQSSSFNSLIKGLCDAGQVDKSIKIMQLACGFRTSFTDFTYFTIMLGLSKSRRSRDLLVVLSRMLVEGYTLDVEEYCLLIKSMIAENRTRDCALFFNLMIDEGLLPDSETVHDLLSCLANHSLLHTISRAVNKLMYSSEILNSSMFNLLINGLWKEGCKTEARQLLDLMLEKGWVPDGITHQVLIGSVLTETESGALCSENSTLQDNVNDILAEGLGNS